MKKIKTILFSVAVVLASLFLCSAGCQNAADSGSSGGGTPPISVTGDEAAAIAAITGLNANSPMLNVTLTGVTSISNGLTTALKNAPYGKINLDLSQTQITSIGDNAFNDCMSLKSVNIPSGVTSIGDDAFSMCESLTSVNIPSSVTSIGKYAFDGCISLKSVNIPSGVTSIGAGAFQSCESFTSVNIPSSVTVIGEHAFEGCKSLASVNIPSGVTDIGRDAFNSCKSLASVNIPSSVTSIGNNAFVVCESLTSVYVKAATPPTLAVDASSGTSYVFYATSSGLKIYVPSASVAAYQGASGWKDYASKIVADPNS